MYKALYREYRPEVFEEMLGQEHIVKILKKQVESDSVNHAYLFCGTRGTGKTTTARLLAKAVNCLSEGTKPCGQCANCKAIKEGSFMDLIEIDAASNNGINDIRELRESVNFPPAVGKKKVYIIDEVHMLSKEAFNGFLKTLEEPPENVMFILATTEPQKLPQTILSRCIRMDFRRVSEADLEERMNEICQKKGIEIDENALKLVAANADGSVRDGLTLLEQCISGREGRVTREDVLDALGAVGEETYIDMTDAIADGDVSRCVLSLNEIFSAGKDARQVMGGLINHYRNLLLTKYVRKPENILNMSMENVERVREQSRRLETSEINNAIIILSKTAGEMTYSTQPRVLLELAVVQMATGMTSAVISKVPPVQQPKTQGQSVRASAAAARQQEQDQLRAKPEEGRKDTDKNRAQDVKDTDGDSVNADDISMEELWNDVCSEAAAQEPMFMGVGRFTFPKKMTPGEIVIGSLNKTTALMLEKQKETFTDILRKLTGSDMNIIIAGSSEKTADDQDVEETAHIVENILGVSVKIED